MILDKGQLLETEQMFRDAGEQWPVIILEEEIRQAASGTKNDLIHAWGLDFQLGYCAQGDRTKNVAVVDSEYIVHLGLPTLGVLDGTKEPSGLQRVNNRTEVRRQSFMEMQIFKKRWNNAVKDDKCWVNPYQQPVEQKSR